MNGSTPSHLFSCSVANRQKKQLQSLAKVHVLSQTCKTQLGIKFRQEHHNITAPRRCWEGLIQIHY